jgi:hypothetical protein
VLERCRQNKRRACDVLDISYHTLMAYLQYRPDGPPAERRGWPEPHDEGGPREIAATQAREVEQTM